MTPTRAPQHIYCGIDTHADTHHAAIITDTGILLAHRQFDTTSSAYDAVVEWIHQHGHPISVGIEGTSSYGAGISRHLRHHHIAAVEVPRPNRKLRRSEGKSDPIDAEAAARAVLARHQLSEPKHGDGPIEAIRALRVARSGAVKAATASMNTIRSMLVTAPEVLRTQLRGRSTTALLDACIALEPDTAAMTDPVNATIVALRSLAKRTRELRREAQELKKNLAALVKEVAPRTASVFGLGPDTAAALLITVGDNPQRLRSESSFAHLCGVAPIPASSGKTNRHRLHRGGDRRANQALHTAVVVCLRYSDIARRYAERRTSEGKSMPEIIRCQKRYLAREVFTALRQDYRALTT
ncbi:IS110 family transposase [Rhodococcus pyridinivorans]|uniref:IS110 family transposase n=1 Tax=Rhodococcus pyridinivorans TaxID=103816 RepID=A0A7M2XMW6_9NOCA|nr:IS110 family transposase [Rhodococcus pyridinivorans]QOV98692.1 IS110 family transposase [Rhodococcus pyridinivorans]WMM72595.1 IS110 family transposase [Rhodococcus pyridinivorans]